MAVGLMQRFGLEKAALARMDEYGVKQPWQAYVKARLRIYEELLSDPDHVTSVRYPHNLALLGKVRREGYPTALATQSHRDETLQVLGPPRSPARSFATRTFWTARTWLTTPVIYRIWCVE